MFYSKTAIQHHFYAFLIEELKKWAVNAAHIHISILILQEVFLSNSHPDH